MLMPSQGIRVLILEFRDGLLGAEQHYAAPLLDCRVGGMEGSLGCHSFSRI